MSTPAMPTSYDEVPYPGFAYSQTHPDHLAAIATLLGLEPVPVATCRVLELGCTDGGNLIPMALAMPEATFVGIDLSAVQIELGLQQIAALGLTNIQLLQYDILAIDPAFGQFDYLIAHGIYSWVPPHVRDALMAICANNLSPHGIAYVSYNTYPGWYIFEPIRALLRYRTAGMADPAMRLAEARALINMVAVEHNADDITGSVLPLSATLLQDRIDMTGPDADTPFLFHDIMEEYNQPVYFHEFVAHADRHGLQYLAEANFPMVLPRGLPDAVVAQIRAMAKTGIDVEQYMDLFRGRMFRQTLLCHRSQSIARVMRPARIMHMAISSRAVPENRKVDLTAGVVTNFRSRDGATLAIDTAISKSAMVLLLAAWPGAIPFEELLAAAAAHLPTSADTPPDTAGLAEQLAADLLTAFCYSENLAKFHTFTPVVARVLSERPVACPLARMQSFTDRPLTSRFHENINTDPMTRQLVRVLDGTRDRAALVREIEQTLEMRPIEFDLDEQADLASAVDRCLRELLWSGMLIA